MTIPQFINKCRRTADDGACDDGQLKAVCEFLAEALDPTDDAELANSILDELEASVQAAREWLGSDLERGEAGWCKVCDEEVDATELDDDGLCETCREDDDADA